MLRRMENKGTYLVESATHNLYNVTMTRLKNNVYGNPRYEVNIINLMKDQSTPIFYTPTYVYRFDGHYMNEYDECHWIVNEHERRING